MRFTPEPEQLAFATALRELFASSDVPVAARAWAAGDAAPGRKLWARLAELGVAEMAADAVGLVLAFEELGRAAVPGPYVESVAVLPALIAIDADTMATLAMPPHVPFAVDGCVADAVYLLRGSTLSTASAVATKASVDRARLLTELEPAQEVAEVHPSAAFGRGALAAAAQLLGAGAALLDRATDYATARRQFGRPIGSFQAVKHQLADAYVALELARPLLFGAAIALGSATAERDVSAAKVACSDAAYRAARTALQVHGAIGYTAEYDLALWLTKVRALTFAWGTQRMHRDRVRRAIGG
ncbi:MAG TPA: acyl-CoA dehydrogenase family protein [Jatrophihabitans sp.]|nr:acyl-CoA dehydrogenase family protein [Jatrophihabitans sp.]